MTEHFEEVSGLREIVESDIERKLPQVVRDVLLDVILAWANLEMASGFFVAHVLGLNPDDGADKFGRKEIADKLRRASKALENAGMAEISSKVREIAQDYPCKSVLRRRIAHSKCVGVRKSNQSFVIFLPFEREGPPGNLAVEIIHLEKFVEAAMWAGETHNYLMGHVDSSNFFGTDLK